MSTTIVGTLVEVRDTFLVLDRNTHIRVPPGMDTRNLVVGERLVVTATSERGRWTAESIERSPV